MSQNSPEGRSKNENAYKQCRHKNATFFITGFARTAQKITHVFHNSAVRAFVGNWASNVNKDMHCYIPSFHTITVPYKICRMLWKNHIASSVLFSKIYFWVTDKINTWPYSSTTKLAFHLAYTVEPPSRNIGLPPASVQHHFRLVPISRTGISISLHLPR